MRIFRTTAVLAVAALLATGLAACGRNDGGGPAALTVYSGRSEALVGPLIQQFTEETGIKVDVRYGDTAQMAAQLLEEGDRSPAHVFLAQDAGALGAVAKAGLFAPLPAEILDRVPAQYRAANGQWVGVTGRSRVLAYDSQTLDPADLPASVFDLTAPEWRGRVGVAPTNASFQAFVTAMRVQHGDDRARQWLTDLAANDPQIRNNNVQIVADIDEGRLAVGLVNHYYVFERAKERGVGIDDLRVRLHFFSNGDTGALVNVSGVGLLASAADNANARRFIEYLLSPTGQRYFAEQTFEYPLIAGVALDPALPPLDELEAPDIDLNDLDTLAATVEMIQQSGLTT
ncbi:MAG: iron ABC transporter substrate-binding protein [Micromonosporaceae bacterium]|nr:iron ABC transporter substrate-binding protein [Micromonosporaceae bacterium]